MKEYKIGDVITLEVVEVKECKCNGCFYDKEWYVCNEELCSKDYRTDNKNIIYKLKESD